MSTQRIRVLRHFGESELDALFNLGLAGFVWAAWGLMLAFASCVEL